MSVLQVYTLCVCKRKCMRLPERGIKTIYKQRKLPISTLKKALSMTNKSIEIHEIWLAVLTAYHGGGRKIGPVQSAKDG